MPLKHSKKTKISRLRSMGKWGSATLHLLLVLAAVMLVSQSIRAAQASADYGDPEELQLNNGSNGGEAIVGNEEIYDPAQLQQEVEASEQRNSVEGESEMEPMKTDAPLRKHRKELSKKTTERVHGRRKQEHHENMTMEEEEYSESVEDDEEYEEDEAKLNAMPTTTDIPSVTTTRSTTITEYVRRAKAGRIPVEHGDKVAKVAAMLEEMLKQQKVKDENSRAIMPNDSSDYDENIVPHAMKFYQNSEGDEAEEEAEDNKLKEQQQKHLHAHRNQSAEEEYYYSDSRESDEAHRESDVMRQNDQGERDENKKKTLTTQAPATINKNTNNKNIALLARAAFGAGIWPTTSAPAKSTTTTAPAAIAPPTPPSTADALSESAASTTTTTAQPPPQPTIVTTSAAAAAAAAAAAVASNKQGKQIKTITSRRKLLPHEQLRNYIEDAYIRMPLAVIVDPSAASLEKTKALWRDALRTNLNIKIVLVSLNASGVPAAYNFNNTRQFLAGLNSIKEHEGGNAFIGIVHASELVPYDSAVFISTAAIPPHTELVQDAAITLLKKRIRLYLIWYGERAISENETQEAVGAILGEVAIRSGGEILHIVGSENSQELEGSTLTLIAEAFHGSQELDIPVDTTLSSLHVKIDAPMRLATLETSNGDINLKKLVKFKSRVMTMGVDDKRLDAYVPLVKIRKSTVFKLKIIPESLEDEYIVFVRAERKADLFLDEMIRRFDSYFLTGFSTYPARFRNGRLQSVAATLAAATLPTHDNLRFPDDDVDEKQQMNDIDDALPKTEVETFSETEIHKRPIVDNATPVEAWNITSNQSTPLANQRAATNVLQRGLTKIEMGLQSQVLVAPGMMAQLQFEITNTRSEAVFHNIQVTDEKRFLQRLVPQSVFIRPGETVIVTVTVIVPSGIPQGTIDKITFTCHGSETATLSLNLKVITTVDAQDTTAPTVSWTFGSRCDHIAYDDATCAERFWTLDITAQDWQTGILRLQSTPAGLLYRNSYTVGTSEPLKATYIATCCEPKVSLIAYDIAGNQRAYTIDVRDIWLTEASIAAIVLGALLLIILIALLIWGIVWCCRRRQVSLDIPTYRSHSTRSME